MTTLTAPRPLTPLDQGGLTLGERLDREWSELRVRGVADCPVCDGRMELDGDAARCRDCRSELH